MSFSSSQLANWLTNASVKYGVPVNVLTGVFGMESDFGANPSTSSAGAMGYMQFIPPTAKAYGYPLTDNPTAAQAQQQIEAAAAKLAHDAGPSKNWAAAINAYGGGYTLSQVNAKFAQAPSSLVQALGTAIVSQPSGVNVPGANPGPGTPAGAYNAAKNAVNSVPQAIASIGTSIGNAFNTGVSDIKTGAVTLALVLLGAMLIFRAFRGDTAGHSRTVIVPA